MMDPLCTRLSSRPPRGRVIAVPRDYDTIQGGIDAAEDGDCVTLSSGVYELDEPLLLNKSIHLISHDESTVSGGAVIKLSSESKKLLRKACHLLVVDSPACRVAEINIEHHTQDLPEGSITFGVYCRGGSVILDQVNVTAIGESAVGVNENVFATLIRCNIRATQHSVYVAAQGRLRVDRCVIRESRSLLFTPHAKGEVDSSTFVNCSIGVEAQHPAEATLQACTFENPTQCGVLCTGGVEVEANVACEISECNFVAEARAADAADKQQQKQQPPPAAATPPLGLVVDAARPLVDKSTFSVAMCLITRGGRGAFTNNVFQKNDVAVRVEGRSNPSFKFNTFEGCATGVLAVERLSQGTFTTNEFVGVAVAGEVTKNANPSFLGNKVARCPVGFKIHGGDGRGAFRGNLLEQCAVGFLLEDGADPVLDQNHIVECGTAITVNRAKGKVLGNRILATDEIGIELTQAAGTWLEDNYIDRTGKEGILLTHESRATLVTNTIEGSKLAPLQLSEDCKGMVQLSDNRCMQVTA